MIPLPFYRKLSPLMTETLAHLWLSHSQVVLKSSKSQNTLIWKGSMSNLRCPKAFQTSRQTSPHLLAENSSWWVTCLQREGHGHLWPSIIHSTHRLSSLPCCSPAAPWWFSQDLEQLPADSIPHSPHLVHR